MAITIAVGLLGGATLAAPPRTLNPALVNIRPNRWVKLHEQKQKKGKKGTGYFFRTSGQLMI